MAWLAVTVCLLLSMLALIEGLRMSRGAKPSWFEYGVLLFALWFSSLLDVIREFAK